jgi:hypothetical protein
MTKVNSNPAPTSALEFSENRHAAHPPEARFAQKPP